jgi:hypothetical protein
MTTIALYIEDGPKLGRYKIRSALFLENTPIIDGDTDVFSMISVPHGKLSGRAGSRQ